MSALTASVTNSYGFRYNFSVGARCDCVFAYNKNVKSSHYSCARGLCGPKKGMSKAPTMAYAHHVVCRGPH